MVIKRGISEDVYDMALQHLNDMVKAKLPEFQFPVVVRSHSSVARLKPDAFDKYRISFRLYHALIKGR